MNWFQAFTRGSRRLWRRLQYRCRQQLNYLKERWQHLNPRWRLKLSLGITSLLIIAILYPIFFAETVQEPAQETPKKPIRYVFTDSDTRQLGIDEALSEMYALRGKASVFEDKLQKLQERERLWQEEFQRQAELLRQQTESLNRLEQNSSQSSVTPASDVKTTTGKVWREQQTGRKTLQSRTEAPLSTETDDPFRQPWYSQIDTERTAVNQANPVPVLVIRSLVAESPPLEPDNSDPSLDLPLVAGSLISGVLINGLDAPTAPDARDQPHPVLVRVQKDAILPNHVLTDIRECFMIFAGFGDMSTERAYLRSESLSCVREDLTTLETQIDSYLVGEDGKAGIRGRLVTKQGKAMALAMMSGFLGGIAKAFDVKPVPMLSTQFNPQVQYQQMFSSDLLQGSAISGAGQALDKVAQFYIQMAEGMFPVVEVDAGRSVDIIVKRFGPLSQPKGLNPARKK